MNGRQIAAAILLLLIVTGGGLYMKARGIRNNNPGNIRRGAIHWNGMAPDQTDSAFVQFIAPEYGIRALARILLTYQEKYGLNTVRGIISRYAPASENDTAAYIDAVARHIGASPDAPLDVRSKATMQALIEAIIRHENGIQPYDVATLDKGLSMAGVIA